MNHFLLFIAMASAVAGCQVRRSDKLADDSLAKTEQQKKDIKQSIEIALKDSTTVQLIDSVHNFGTVVDGAVVRHSFSFKNTGTKPLVIQDVHASCGCTVPEKPEKPVMPGETAVIKVSFNTAGKGGGYSEKSITVNSNARPAFGLLRLVGTITKPS